MQNNKKKILFIFNQLLSGTHMAGGEVRGLRMRERFEADQNFEVSLLVSKYTTDNVGNTKAFYVGENVFEKNIYSKKAQWRPFNVFVLYFMRTIESIKFINKIDVDVVYSTGDFFCDTIPAFIFKLFHPKTKWVCCVHHINESPRQREQVGFLSALVSFIGQKISFLLIKISCDQVFSINNLVKNSLVKTGINDSKIVVTGNGLGVKKMEFMREKNETTPKENKICFFSRLDASKGALDLPEIFSKIVKVHPDLRLEIVGSVEKGVLEKVVEGFKNYNSINNVDILGFVEDKDEALQKVLMSKAVIFPTYEEGWGLCLFESILFKLPVVVYKLPIFDELFGESIMSAKIGNREEFADKVLFCLDPSNAETVSKAVESCYQISKKYDWDNVFNSERQRIQLLL